MNCPKCKMTMQPVTVGEYTVERCTGCGGLWFDLREHEHIAESKSDVKRLDKGDPAKGKQQDALRDISCPVCNVKMIKLSVPTQAHIHYESCPICFGAFFDAGEFSDFASHSFSERVHGFFRGFKRRSAK